MTTKIDLTNITDTALTTLTGPKVTTIVYPGDDTATDTVGGAVINLTGNGFQSGCSVLVASTASSVVSFINATQISFVAPALVAGTYVIYVINPDGGTAISIPGISYSGTPNWTTAAGTLGTAYETGAISATLAATGDAPISYSLTTGTLPPGSTLNSNGTLSGTAAATASATTYSFTIKASDAQNQDTNRAFSITINPDVVTFNTPADSTTYNVFKDAAIANVAMSATSAAGGSITYTADTLPTGLSISGANIAGTPTVVASTTTVLTATSTSTRTATRTINWVVSIANDTFWKNTTLLLNGETSVTPFINDASTNNLGLTINGDTKPSKFSPYNAAYYSEVISANNSTTIPNNAAFQFGTGDFTVEFWVKAPSQAGAIVAQATASSPNWGILATSGNLYWQSGFQAVSLLYFTFAFTGEWQHIAYARSSGTLKCYVNGVLGGSIADSTNYTGTGTLTFGPSGYGLFAGSIADFRIVKGTAVYTAAFSVPSAPLTAIAGTSLLISSASSTVTDSSPNNFTITKGTMTVTASAPYAPPPNTTVYGSGLFPTDTGVDHLRLPASVSGLTFPADFTLEFWVYVTGTQVRQFFGSTTAGKFRLYVNAGYLQLYGNSASYLNVSAAGAWPNDSSLLNQWVHIAISRTGSNLQFFVNGISKTLGAPASGAVTDTIDFDNRSYIGTYDATKGFQGYMADFRAVKGTALYTANFTPPTTPLTAVANTSLLTLQYNGGANNSGIIDNSSFNNIVTRFGNTSQGTFSPYSQTGWSNYFPGGQSTYVTGATNAIASYGAGNYTLEAWCYSNSLGYGSAGCIWYFAQTTVNAILRHNGAVWECYYGFNGATFTSVSTSVVGINQWVHHAVVRNGSTTKWYINGIERGSATDTYNYTGTGTMQIGNYAAYGYDGYISNLRYVKGTAVYTAAFTPPTAPLTAIPGTLFLSAQSNRFIDNGPLNTTLTITGTPTIQAFSPFGSISEATPASYSNYFDGDGDYLSIPYSTSISQTSPYTLEFWFYPTYNYSGQYIFAQSGGGAFGLNWTGTVMKVDKNGVGIQITGTTILALNQWHHYAMTYDGTTTRVFANGALDGSVAGTGGLANVPTTIGFYTAVPSSSYGGYISNLRIVKGTALYTSNFTPSTTPLTAIANTVLLTCQSTTMIDNSTNRFRLTANGDVKPRIFNPFGYTAQSAASYTPSLHGGSAYFDGTGDYLTLPSSSNFAFGTGNFSVEFWVYPTVNVRQDWLDFTDGTNRMLIYYNGTNIVHYILPTVAGAITGSAPIFNTWNHIAISRSSGSTIMFINGVQSGSTYTDSKSYPNVNLTIGKDNAGSTHITGYMSDVKVTKGGTGLYTSNFIPPTQTLTSSTSTPASLLLNFTNGGIIDQHSTNVLETVGNAQLSTSVKKYNNASIYFDGTGDSLKIIDNPNINLGSGDFTLECWVYFNAVNAQMTIISKGWNSSSAYASYLIWMTNTASLNFLASSNGGAWDIANERVIGTMTAGVWTHIAVTRSGTTFRAFINGVINNAFTFTSSASLANIAAQTLFIGDRTGGDTSLNGYIDDLRITKGVARYTSNFTAPTSALITK